MTAHLLTNTTGKLIGTKTVLRTNNPIYSSATKDGLELRENLPSMPIHQLTVSPFLRVRAIKEQFIDFQVSTKGDVLKWAGTDAKSNFDEVVVSASRVSDVVKGFQLSPLPCGAQ